MSFTFDAPVSATASAYDKAHRLKSRVSRLPPRALTASIASSSSFLDNVSHRVRNSFRRSNTSDSSNPPSMPSSAASKPSKPVSATESPFFHLPLELRETSYGLVVARRETLHIMMKRRPNRLLPPLVHPLHRRVKRVEILMSVSYTTASGFSLREGKVAILGHLIPSVGSCGRVEECMPSSLRFRIAIKLQVERLRLLFTTVCRFQEVSNFLYTQNTFEFDHPMSLMTFKKTVYPSLLNCIKSISINLQRDLYNPGGPTQAFKFLRLDVWPDMWDIIAEMEGLEVIRVKFQFPLKGWLGWSEKKVLEPLWNVTRPMRVFEVDS